MAKDERDEKESCIVPSHPVPPEELARYSIERDPHSEQDIANYVEGQARDEIVQHVEKVKQDVVLGEIYEIWDVTTDKERWWVITNLTNLYSQKHFPSLDYTLSFHIGLMVPEATSQLHLMRCSGVRNKRKIGMTVPLKPKTTKP